MKKMIFFLLAALLVMAFSCRRSDEVNPVPQAVDQPNDSLKIQGLPVLIPSVIAGAFNQSGSADGAGTSARFNKPMGIFTKSDGSLLVADYQNHAIRRISTAIIGAPGVVTTPYHTTASPTDVAAIADGAVGVVSDYQVTVFNHGTHVTRSTIPVPSISLLLFAGIDRNPGSTFFLYGVNSGQVLLSGPYTALSSINEHSASPLSDILISDSFKDFSSAQITSLSIAANDNKFITTHTQVLECTHSGTVFNVIPGTVFSGLTSIIANHDGTKLYVADAGFIKLITRCSTCKPTLTTLLIKGPSAYGLALSNDERVLYFTSAEHHTVNRVVLP